MSNGLVCSIAIACLAITASCGPPADDPAGPIAKRASSLTYNGPADEPLLANTAPQSSGKLRLLLHDAPADVDQLWVALEEVAVYHPEQGWLTVSAQPQKLDLLTLQDGVVAQLGLAELPPGNYTKIRLNITDAWVVVPCSGDVDSATNGAKKTERTKKDACGTLPLSIGSAAESQLQIDHAFSVPECGTRTITLDWNSLANLSHEKKTGWILQPKIRVTNSELNTCGCRTTPTVTLTFKNPMITIDGLRVAHAPDGLLTVSVETTNFKLVAKQGYPHQEGEGHGHLYIDVPLSNQFIPPYITLTNHDFVAKAQIDGKDVQGLHTLFVVLVQNDHIGLKPTVLAEGKFFVGPRP
ncbi:MAG: DUF4382 domain-containing protein [Deltaproteobacteria bacterium]|nr:DUF4382 domain-containing protein [Deltaproteobacteria bacterium]